MQGLGPCRRTTIGAGEPGQALLAGGGRRHVPHNEDDYFALWLKTLRYDVDGSEVTRRWLALPALLGALLTTAVAAPPAQAAGDDYPYRADTTQSSDPWGFTKRQCVSFAAWELKQHGTTVSNGSQHWGNARDWDEAARRLGRTVTTRPKVGAVAQWNAGERSTYYPDGGGTGTVTAGSYGHVAYVTNVYADGSVRVEQYNMFGNRAFSAMHLRAPRYLYVA